MQLRTIALSATALFACTGDVITSGGGGGPNPNPGAAPVLNDVHLGWKAQNCETCHELPVANHTQTESASCATCHGGNGACLADGPSVARVHEPGEDCVSCHEQKHGFVAKSECASCHYAKEGAVDCMIEPITPGIGGLSDNLAANCYDMRAGNPMAVPTQTAIRVGEAAVDFQLNDRNGQPHRLADLLQTKPVALVFGAFT